MKYRMLDADGDYVFGRGKHAYLEGGEAVAQAVKTRLLLLLGEWWEDLEEGLPLWTKIVGTRGTETQLQAVDLIFKDRIYNTLGVKRILNFTSRFHNRAYIFTAAIDTEDGPVLITNDMKAAAKLSNREVK